MSVEKKRELQVAALENGTAIDHIPPSQLLKWPNCWDLKIWITQSRSETISKVKKWDAKA